MTNIIYDNYLTENNLINIFKQLHLHHLFNFELKTNIKIGTRFRGDLNIITSKNSYLIEFDGSFHFENALTIYRDIQKDEIWYNTYKTKTIRIPYFVQMATNFFKYIFVDILKDIGNPEINIITNYPHGFIDKKATLPASFCPLGIERFERFLEVLKDNIPSIYNDILISLINKDLHDMIVFYPNFKDKFNIIEI